jgi:hypothetical protein
MQTEVGEVAVANASALGVVKHVPVFVIDTCLQAPIGAITTLRPDSVELQPG